MSRHSALGVLVAALVVLSMPRRGSAQAASPATAGMQVPQPSRRQLMQPVEGHGLQAPAQRSTRNSAFTLPAGTWGTELGVLGVSSEELYGSINLARGFRHGIQLDLNLLHWSTSIFNANARWAFYEREHLGLSIDAGVYYAHGEWLWILGDVMQGVVSDSDLIGLPAGLVASAPLTRWLQLDVSSRFQYAQIFGSIGDGNLVYADTEIGARRLYFLPVARFFVSRATAVELAAVLPAWTRVPTSVTSTVGAGMNATTDTETHYKKVPFSKNWNLELAVRSRIRSWLYTNVRIQYGKPPKAVYGSTLFPAFSLEFRYGAQHSRWSQPP